MVTDEVRSYQVFAASLRLTADPDEIAYAANILLP
jgi:hypothetical protein